LEPEVRGRGYGLIEGESSGEGKKCGLLLPGEADGIRTLLFTLLLGIGAVKFELLVALGRVGLGGAGLSKGSKVLKKTGLL
jgi:hypothetical protein